MNAQIMGIPKARRSAGMNVDNTINKHSSDLTASRLPDILRYSSWYHPTWRVNVEFIIWTGDGRLCISPRQGYILSLELITLPLPLFVCRLESQWQQAGVEARQNKSPKIEVLPGDTCCDEGLTNKGRNNTTEAWGKRYSLILRAIPNRETHSRGRNCNRETGA